jgi:hypothetical protein
VRATRRIQDSLALHKIDDVCGQILHTYVAEHGGISMRRRRSVEGVLGREAERRREVEEELVLVITSFGVLESAVARSSLRRTVFPCPVFSSQENVRWQFTCPKLNSLHTDCSK